MIKSKKVAQDGNTYAIIQDSDITGRVQYREDDTIVIPKKPIWIANPTEGNPNAALRVMVCKVADGNLVPAPAFKSHFVNYDRANNNAIAFDNELSSSIALCHNLFTKKVAGKILRVSATKNISSYAYTPSGAPEFEDDGVTRKFRKATAYDWEVVGDADEDQLTKAAELTKAYVISQYAVTPEE